MYKVPQHIHKNKIFIVQRSEIEGRLDPHYNKPEYSELHDLLNALPSGLSTLRNESNAIFSGITPKSGGDAYSVAPDAIPFVRSGDFSETNQIDFSSLLYLYPEIHYGVMASSRLQKNDLLFAIVGATIGKIGVYIYDREANINQAICGVRLKDGLNPFYVQAFYQTLLGQKLIERAKRPVARANLNLEEIGNLPILMVDEKVQWKVVDKIKSGISGKLQKEKEAQQLLDSIDAYLLDELGITLPEVKTELSSRIFLSSYRELMEGRLDPEYTLYFDKDCKSIKYDSVPLGTIAYLSKGTALTSKEVIPGNVPVIAGGQTSPYSHAEANFSGNVITVSASGAYAGYVWYHENPIFASDCSVVQSKNEGVFKTKFLFEVLKALQPVIYRLQIGAAQPHVYPADLWNIFIPIIPINQQNRMCELIERKRQQAKALQAEGKSILENAKKEVERMILGEL